MTAPSKRPTRALFWDIDGTLLVTGRAGMIAWERAFAVERAGAAFPAVRPDGLTDHQIAAWLLGQTLAAADATAQHEAARLVARYEQELGPALPLRQGRVLDNVTAVLERVRGRRPDLLSWLVTGNTRIGGAIKLRHYGLDGFFTGPTDGSETPPLLLGAFSARVEPRASIVRRALDLAQAQCQGLDASEVLVIGDTPHDIEGAHAIGVPVLAVASNAHSFEELAAHHPWRVLPALPDPDTFEGLLG